MDSDAAAAAALPAAGSWLRAPGPGFARRPPRTEAQQLPRRLQTQPNPANLGQPAGRAYVKQGRRRANGIRGC